MTLLILGLVLWWGAHLLKRLAPELRARIGEKGRGIISIVLLASVALMVLGYRSAEVIDVWYPPTFMTHFNNALMILAFYFFAASGMKTAITRKVRHPQLTGVKTWAIAHLLVNGDLASIVLFGGLLAWAVVSVILINRAQPEWTRPAPVAGSREIMAIVGTIVVTGLAMVVHNWLGVQPWG